jgi:DNA-binding transcriptional MerR regulator
MQIGEAAKQASLTMDAIRFYERRALLPKAARTTGRFRLYTADDVARLQLIRQMQGRDSLFARFSNCWICALARLMPVARYANC